MPFSAKKSSEMYTFEKLQESAGFIQDKISIRPKIGIICGSGLGSLADSLTEKQILSYEDIPYFPTSTVEGHAGKLVFGYLENVPVMCMQGRFHYYEGYPLWKCSMPIRVMKFVGVTHLIATHAAGGINPKYEVGDIMMIKDHVNLMGFAGNNPLLGSNDDRLGPRFVTMDKAYSPEILEVGAKVAAEMKISELIHEGVVTCLGGPNYETVAELKMLKMVGVDAVGMSIVHEVICARHCGLTVFAFSVITNKCACDYDSYEKADHEKVIEVGRLRQPMIQEFLTRIVQHLQPQLNGKNGSS